MELSKFRHFLDGRGIRLREASTRQFLTIFLAISFTICFAGSGSSETLVFGVNRPKQRWLPPTAWQVDLQNMRRAGVTELRYAVTDPIDNSIQAIVAAGQLGIRVLVSFNLNVPSFYPPGIQMRSGYNGQNPAYRMSDIDPQRVVSAWRKIHDAMEREHVPLAGAEIGNEVDWGGANGDLPEGDSARFFKTKADLNNETGRRIAIGYDRLVEIVSAINRSDPNRSYPLLVGGLASFVTDYGAQFKMSALDINLALQLLFERKISQMADGISLHMYPPIRGHTVDRCSSWPGQWLAAMQFCRRGSQPEFSCWVTETGVKTSGAACESNGERRQDFSCMRSGFISLNQTYRIQRVYLFAWQGTVPSHMLFSLFRNGSECGEATEFFR